MKIAVTMITIWLLVTLSWANALAEEASTPPLIQQGIIEVSTLGALMGSNILGLGASISKAEDEWMGTLGLSIGYFLTPFAEIEGSFGVMRSWEGDFNSTTSVGIGKLVLNYPQARGGIVVPYAFGGIGLMNLGISSDFYDASESKTLATFGGGIKVPLVLLKKTALRAEYSYTRNLDIENSIHSFSVGFSVFL